LELRDVNEASNGMSKLIAHVVCVVVGLALVEQPAIADEARWSFEALIGDAYNLDSRTRVRQEAVGHVSLEGDYETRGLEGPLHYAWRISRWNDDKAWELQLLHHKLYLQDPPNPIEALSVSHGFNIITVNRAFEFDQWRARVGVGPVLAHAEARIAGTSYDGPYELAGVAALVGAGRILALTTNLYVLGEISATFGYIEANPEGAPELEFSIRNPALHAQIGLGYQF
jgi:hypothetical protein